MSQSQTIESFTKDPLFENLDDWAERRGEPDCEPLAAWQARRFLMEAVSRFDAQSVEDILVACPEWSKRYVNNREPAIEALRNGDRESLLAFCKHTEIASWTLANGDSFIEFAASRGQVENLKILIPFFGPAALAAALRKAAREKHQSVVEFLVSKCDVSALPGAMSVALRAAREEDSFTQSNIARAWGCVQALFPHVGKEQRAEAIEHCQRSEILAHFLAIKEQEDLRAIVSPDEDEGEQEAKGHAEKGRRASRKL